MMTATRISLGKVDLSRLAVATLAIALALQILAGVAHSLDEVKTQEVKAQKADSSTRPNRRAEGIAYLDLPLRLRARVDFSFMDDLYVSDALARPFASAAGPSFDDAELLESQFVLTRSLSDKIEIGIVWGLRSPVGRMDLFDFERQTIGAMIRLVP